MFFGLSIGIILFLFLARVAFAAFIMAGIMSIVYAVYRRLRDFVTYDRFGKYYIPRYDQQLSIQKQWNNEVEPLFHEAGTSIRSTPVKNIQFIDAI